jgi:hypothetical protein
MSHQCPAAPAFLFSNGLSVSLICDLTTPSLAAPDHNYVTWGHVPCATKAPCQLLSQAAKAQAAARPDIQLDQTNTELCDPNEEPLCAGHQLYPCPWEPWPAGGLPIGQGPHTMEAEMAPHSARAKAIPLQPQGAADQLDSAPIHAKVH